MNSNIHFIRRHPVYRADSPTVTLPLGELHDRINKGIAQGLRTGMCMGAGLTALLTFVGIMIAGWAAA